MILCTCKYFKYRYAMRHWSHASEYVKVVFGSMTTFKKNYENLHKIAFTITLIFGITCLLLTPIFIVNDESEIKSDGVYI